MDDWICPQCEEPFDTIDELYTHALNEHTTHQLSNLLEEHMTQQLTKDDFTQIDSQWIFAMGKFHLALIPNEEGTFSLHVYGSIEPIPKATQYPTEPEWEKALALANKFVEAYKTAVNRE